MSDIDERKLALDEARLRLDQSFAKKWAPSLASAVISLAIGLGTIWISMQNARLSKADQDLKQKLALVDYFTKYYSDPDYVKLSDDKRSSVLGVLSSAFSQSWPSISAAVTDQVVGGPGANASISDDARYATLSSLPSVADADAAAPAAGESSRSAYRIYLHYKNAADQAVVQSLAAGMASLGYKMPGIQLVTQATNGDVRYYRKDEKDDAERLKADVQKLLSAAQPVSAIDLKLIDISKSFHNLPAGIMEVWIPGLSHG